mmetsp:Transcript_39277/g.122952  ORF Transcript_39277/g.122952 Transcript_39277/m.122952 type:complete len:83 (-) Transcript_39277:58-306(-)
MESEAVATPNYGKARWEEVRANWVGGSNVQGMDIVPRDEAGTGVAEPRPVVVEEVIDAIMIPPQNRDPRAGELPHPVPLLQV